jgi:hypothetical protein
MDLVPPVQVHTSIVKCNTDDSSSIGQIMCDYVQKQKSAVLVMMKKNKGAIVRWVALPNSGS